MDRSPIPGIHHVTAIGGDPQENLDFYTGVLGLRLVKTTVNFDDPTTYHLYYGDATGSPGTIMTFFPWPGARRGRRGTGQATVIQFAVPRGSLEFWHARLTQERVRTDVLRARMGERYLACFDRDGLKLELVETETPTAAMPWERGSVPQEYAIYGFRGVTLELDGYESTARLLTEVMGFTDVVEEQERFRFSVGRGQQVVDLLCKPGDRPGVVSVGTVHHVAWRVTSDQDQVAWRERLLEASQNVTPPLDRRYFRSIYFREPGGVLFEMATDGPGFATDESAAELGMTLQLPPWLEEHRVGIEAALPAIRRPGMR